MRVLLLTTGLLTLSGCAGLPAPDPTQAWIDLDTHQDSALQALEVDEKLGWTVDISRSSPATMS